MDQVVKLVRPEITPPNERIVEEIQNLLDEAKTGGLTGFIAIKFLAEGKFAMRKVGHLSDLEVCGALDFTKYDIISNNQPN